jgi:tRNA (guanine37-N1)-methyltransferase
VGLKFVGIAKLVRIEYGKHLGQYDSLRRMRVDIITLFPEIVTPYFEASIMKRAGEKKCVEFRVHNLRKWAQGKHRQIDDRPFGGGPGMIMMVEPIVRALRALRAKEAMQDLRPRARWRSRPGTRVILMSAKGKQFTQRRAMTYAKKYDRLVILCGRYEGVDERVARYCADEEISVGPYVLTGGELPALTVADSTVRLLPGVLGNDDSLIEESFSPLSRSAPSRHNAALLEAPHYTRPATYSPTPNVHWRVPAVLTSGDHGAVAAWRETYKMRTE